MLSEESTNRTVTCAVDLNQILEERDACGVGVIASLKGERTHKCVDDSLSALGCMEHRGACSADNDSGDAGAIMTQIPWQMLSKWCAANGISGFSEESSAVSMTFLPTDKGKRTKAKAELEKAIAAEGLKVLGWRDACRRRMISSARWLRSRNRRLSNA